jgi:hypothetical protein
MTETLTDACVHHWVLSTPDDEVVRGRCKRCGAVRDYPASVEQASRFAYEEAAAVGRAVRLLPDFDSGPALSGTPVA